MQVLDHLRDIAQNDASIFRRQLAKEDIARLERLGELAEATDDLESFRKDGLYIGWTQNDMRTHDLQVSIQALLDAYFAWNGSPTPETEEAVVSAWEAFHRDRLNKLIHCL